MFNALIGGNNYFMWMIPGLLLTIYAQFHLKRKFKKYSKIENSAGITGQQTARKILNSEDLQSVKIKAIKGRLTDHYDPRNKTVNLSQPIYNKTSLGAMGVAAHETGHAIQDKDGYIWMRIRGWIVPLANIGTNLGYILIVAGLIIGLANIARIGVLLFLLTTLFALITLPVEFNASKRAKKKLQELGLTEGEEDKEVDDVLDAAAFTYVASFATSAIQGLYWALTVREEFHEEEDSGSSGSGTLGKAVTGATVAGSVLAGSAASKKEDDDKDSKSATATAAGAAGKILTGSSKNDDDDDTDDSKRKTLAGTATAAAGKALTGSGKSDDEAEDEKSSGKTLTGAAVGAAGKALTGDKSESSESTYDSRRSTESSDESTDDEDDDKKGLNPVKAAKTATEVVKTTSKLTGS